MDGTAKIRLVALGMLLLTLWGCNDLKTELQPDSLLPTQLPDVQVPVDSNGNGTVDVASVMNLVGSYSVQFGKPRHGTITISGPNGNVITYQANPGWYTGWYKGDTAQYTIVKKLGGMPVDTSFGNLYFYRPADCQTEARDDVYETDSTGPYFLPVLVNDDFCNPVTIEVGNPSVPGSRVYVADDNRIVYSPKISWAGTDQFSYTLIHRGLRSTAQVTITRSACHLVPKPDTVYFRLGAQSFTFLADTTILKNDDNNCRDLDNTIIFMRPDSIQHYRGNITQDSRNPLKITCTIDTNHYTNPGFFSYAVKRRQDPISQSAWRWTRVYVKPRR